MPADGPHRYEPDYAVPPGETLQETIDALGMSQKELAVRTGLTPKTVNRIIKGTDPVTRVTAIKLQRATGVPANMWNTMEMHYRERLAQVADRARLESDLGWLKSIPTRELVKRGAIKGTRDKVELLARVLAFFGVSGREEWEELWLGRLAASSRKSQSYKMEPGPTATWLRLGELSGQQIECAPYDKSGFVEALEALRSQTIEPPEVFLGNLIERCSDAGVAVVLVPEIRGCPAYGVTRWVTPGKALVQLGLRYKSDDQFWFSFFHEAWHVLHGPKRGMSIDYGDDDDGEDERADAFAANFLIPPEHVGALRRLRSKVSVESFARRIGIAPGIVVGRLQKEGIIPYRNLNGLKRKFVWKTQ